MEEQNKINIKHNHSGGDYVKINMRDLTGTMWDDCRTPVNAIKINKDKPPTWVSYMGSEVLSFADQAIAGNEESVEFTVQLPHSYKEGSSLRPHIHWLAEDNTAGNARWQLTYAWANLNGIFATSSETITAAAPAVANKHTFSEFTPINGDGKLASSILLGSLKRKSSEATDTLDGKNAYFLEFDIHYVMDSIGSKTDLNK